MGQAYKEIFLYIILECLFVWSSDLLRTLIDPILLWLISRNCGQLTRNLLQPSSILCTRNSWSLHHNSNSFEFLQRHIILCVLSNLMEFSHSPMFSFTRDAIFEKVLEKYEFKTSGFCLLRKMEVPYEDGNRTIVSLIRARHYTYLYDTITCRKENLSATKAQRWKCHSFIQSNDGSCAGSSDRSI